ncbi:PREDICTED: transcription factor E2FC-like [Nelumbo nucifera]|uniref:Transcription factor E2FC-like n=2 Tax=Nelumbo nucifera TaxID=4432 RepID=A0A1U7ZP82_NELNU|nr:PREDICTED: transcription factor E2FC-like [Nelumbo nucifera]DAD40513.1 TPA_asm: hypothetical protein HUJ06_014836 [Nelumbo nucifera]
MSVSGQGSSRPHQQPQYQFQLHSQSQSQIQASSYQILGPMKRHFPFSSTRLSSFSFAPSPQSYEHRLSPDLSRNSQSGHTGAGYGEPTFCRTSLKQTKEMGHIEAQSGKWATHQGYSEADNSPLTPIRATGGKRISKQKMSKHRKYGPQTPGSNTENPANTLTPSSSCRYDSSLGLLTKKFISLIQEAKDGTLDLNNTADVLEVQKRRIYDITNVLEGIGLIEKTSKNNIRWKGLDMSRPTELDDQVARLKAEVESLYDEECRLDNRIRERQASLRAMDEDEKNRKFLFLTEEDIMNLPCFQNHTLVAIKAPQASSLEVPDPDEDADYPQRQFRIIVRSTTGPIDLYLLSKYEGQCEDINVRWTKLPDTYTRKINHNREADLLQKIQDTTLSESGQNQDNQRISSSSLSLPGIQKIVPSDFNIDDDYWFHSDLEVSITDLWGNEEWAEVDEFLKDEFVMSDNALEQPQMLPGAFQKHREIEMDHITEKT